MDKIKNMSLLSQMQTMADSLLRQIERLENEGGELHAIDVDLLRDKTRMLYDLMSRLQHPVNASVKVFDDQTEPDEARAVPAYEVPLEVASQNLPNGLLSKPSALEKIEAEILEDEFDASEIKSEKQNQAAESTIDAFTDALEPDHGKPEHHQPTTVFGTHRKETPASTLDLFGDTQAVADKYQQADNSLAAKMERSKIHDLREAIGINDKFLMINELFEGNISYYNHAIDELNTFQSYNGAKTYLIELSVQHQWSDDSAAVSHIHQLIERKFGHVV